MDQMGSFLWFRPGICHLIRTGLIIFLVNTLFTLQEGFEREPEIDPWLFSLSLSLLCLGDDSSSCHWNKTFFLLKNQLPSVSGPYKILIFPYCVLPLYCMIASREVQTDELFLFYVVPSSADCFEIDIYKDSNHSGSDDFNVGEKPKIYTRSSLLWVVYGFLRKYFNQSVCVCARTLPPYQFMWHIFWYLQEPFPSLQGSFSLSRCPWFLFSWSIYLGQCPMYHLKRICILQLLDWVFYT